jgi:acyl-CoA synthetase (AMP-forming)/AMP-acid ligase II
VYESFATVWERVADAIPEAPAVVQGDRRVTYREVEDRAGRLAGALAARGVGHDTKVALFLHNCPEYMELLFALSKLRALPANVNFRYLGDELVQLVDNADAEVLVHHRSLRDRVDAARDRMPGVRHTIEIDDDGGDSEYEALLRAHEPAPRIERSGDDLLLWYTGGTTGLPKGVLWHQGTLLGYGLIAAYALQDETPPDPGSLDQLIADVRRWRERGTPLVSLLTTPLVHATAVHQANTAFAVGGTVVLLERGRTDGDAICTTIARERPSVLEVVGDVLMRRVARALDADPARAADLAPELIRWQSPNIHTRRTALEDVEFRGARIRRGDKVVLWQRSANRDERVFDEPNALRIDRPNARRHLGFGWGIHRCIGARLAEMEVRVVWEEILRRGMRFRIVEPPRISPNNFINGYDALIVEILA